MSGHSGHRALLTKIWGPEHAEDAHYLRTVVNRLRAVIEVKPDRPKILLTEVGVGYRLASPTGASPGDFTVKA